MRFSSMRYLVREGFRSIWQNRFMALASIAVLVSCLLLTGGAFLVFVNLNKACDWAYDQNVIAVFAKENSTADQLKSLEDKLKGTTNIQSVQFTSKQEVLEEYKDTLSEDIYKGFQDEDNPCLDLYVVTMKDVSSVSATVEQIKQIPEVDSVEYSQRIAEALAKIRHAVLWIGGGIISLLFLVSLFIIINTIKLTVYNRRLEISIMKSVGATNAFVRTPFIVEGIVLGVLAGFSAYGILYLLYTQLLGAFQIGIINGLVDFSAVWYQMLGGFLTIGILTGIVGSVISIGKYLKNEGGISRVM